MMKGYLIILILLAYSGINVNAQNSGSPEQIGRMMFNAVANGDVPTIRSITTKEFFSREFPLSDQEIKEALLSVPAQKREVLRELGNKSTAYITEIDSESVIVTYRNKTNGKEFVMKMKKINGKWKVDKYGY